MLLTGSRRQGCLRKVSILRECVPNGRCHELPYTVPMPFIVHANASVYPELLTLNEFILLLVGVAKDDKTTEVGLLALLALVWAHDHGFTLCI